MRKSILVLGVAILALALAGVALATSAFTQTSKVGFTEKKSGASTGITGNLVSRDASAPFAKPKETRKVVITFPANTQFNLGTSAVNGCHLTDQEIRKSQFGPFCPNSSQVGSGTAVLNTMPMGTAPVSATVKVFRHVNSTLYIVVFPDMKQIPTWQPWVLHATASGPRLTITIPEQKYGKGPGVPDGVHAVLTKLAFKISAAGSGSNALIRSGSCTSGRFKVSSHFTYEDHSQLEVPSSSTCSR